MRKLLLIICLICVKFVLAQELNANVVINAQFTGNENFQRFKSLEKQLNEFIKNTKWTEGEVLSQERLDCNFVVTINSNSGNSYSGTLQVQSSRPVFGASYTSPIYNINDKNFSFTYNEFQNIIYNKTQFQSNLISVITFHLYMVLGFDADSFALNGGTEYFKQAQTILNYSQQENATGWKLSDGQYTRFVLIDHLLSPGFSDFRTVNYKYHRLGLDIMSDDNKAGKQQIAKALIKFKDLARERPNSYLVRAFFDAKAEEIEQIFSGGPKIEITELLNVLNRVSPTKASLWRNIKY